MSPTARRCLHLIAMCLLAAGCGAVQSHDEGDQDSGAGTGTDAGTGETGFSIAVASGRLLVRQEGSAALDVTVTREADFGEPITITVQGLSAGVTAEPLTIAGRETSGTVTIGAAGDSTQGALDVEVTANAGELTRSVPLRLLVAGAPGTLDLSFASGGLFTFQIGGGADTQGVALALQSDGKAVVAGGASPQGGSFQALALRLNSDGALDDSFGSGGVVSSGIGVQSAGFSVAASTGGRIVVGGYGIPTAGGLTTMAVFGFTAAGEIDTSYGTAGTVLIDSGTQSGFVRQLLEVESGAIVAVGSTSEADAAAFLHAVRLTAAGVPDPSFNIVAPALLPVAAILDRKGRTLVAGRKEATDPTSFVARYSPDGVADATFNGSGVVETNFVPSAGEGAAGLVELEGGKIMTAGSAQVDGAASLTLARYNPNGSPDLTFGDGGQLIMADTFVTGPLGNSAILDGEQRLLLAGHSRPPLPEPLPAVARFLSDGTLDTAFGDAGVATIDFSATGDALTSVYGLAVDPDGRVVAAGTIGPEGGHSIAVARLWP